MSPARPFERQAALAERAAANFPLSGRRAGTAISRMRGVSPSRVCSSPSCAAVRPINRSAGWPRSRSPARLASRSALPESKAKTATSISSITRRSSASASRAPSRCSLSVSCRALTSRRTAPSTSSLSSSRARSVKCPSRSPARRLAMTCSGRMTRSCAARAATSQRRTSAPSTVREGDRMREPARGGSPWPPARAGRQGAREGGSGGRGRGSREKSSWTAGRLDRLATNRISAVDDTARSEKGRGLWRRG